jgi:hypothetical protein
MLRLASLESRHPLLLHRLFFATALLTYGVDRPNLIFRIAAISAAPARAAHLAFGCAAFLLALSLLLRRVDLRRDAAGLSPQKGFVRRQALGDLCYALGLSVLLPATGAALWLLLETVRAVRYARLRRSFVPTRAADLPTTEPSGNPAARRGVAREPITACAVVSMVFFAITLSPRTAELMFGVTGLLSLAVDAVISPRTRREDRLSTTSNV